MAICLTDEEDAHAGQMAQMPDIDGPDDGHTSNTLAFPLAVSLDGLLLARTVGQARPEPDVAMDFTKIQFQNKYNIF